MHEQRRGGEGGGGGMEKEGGKYDAFSRREKGGRAIVTPGFPVGVNWGKEQQKARDLIACVQWCGLQQQETM